MTSVCGSPSFTLCAAVLSFDLNCSQESLGKLFMSAYTIGIKFFSQTGIGRIPIARRNQSGALGISGIRKLYHEGKMTLW